MNSPQYLLYLSHSWLPEHVDANIALWDQLHADCCFLADDNRLENPPYFVSRIEYLIRRADCFVAFVPPSRGSASHAGLSPYVLFEIALADRAGIPSLVIADSAVPLDAVPPTARCLPLDLARLMDTGQTAWDPVQAWLAGIVAAKRPKEGIASDVAAVLVSESDHLTLRTIEATLRREGYARVNAITTAGQDVEVRRMLQEADVLVADVGVSSLWDRYGMAHALAVPTIRCAAPGAALPSLTGGHPQGYDQDVIRWSSATELDAEVTRRVRSIRGSQILVDSREEGREFFERRRQ